MSLYESKDSRGEVSLGDLFKGGHISAEDDTRLEKIAFLLCRGGWPKAVGLDERPALFQAMDYVDAIVSTDISRVDSTRRDKEKAKRLLRSYAHIGTQSSLETIRRICWPTIRIHSMPRPCIHI